MGREVKRVPMDFDWPIHKTWPGYCITFYDNITDGMRDKFEQIMARVTGDSYYSLQVDPPEGEGYQMWETTSEGSPISPVFKTPEELARWLADNGASSFGSSTATYEQWLAMIHRAWAPSMVITYGLPGKVRIEGGVEACSSTDTED